MEGLRKRVAKFDVCPPFSGKSSPPHDLLHSLTPRNDYWQDLEILPENNVRLQANDDNEVDENVDDYRYVMDINADDQNVESPARNSKNTASSYSSGPKRHCRSLGRYAFVAHCMLVPMRVKKQYVRLFVSGHRREDPLFDAYLHEDEADDAVGDEEPDDIFKQV
ncbi:hypothetical protein Fot_15063 [Forsythia ovata]|uniref:Uncharacterized protein n=1 Tax=Forsythia ovata TaxID=205694 RepID=A0ABD1W8L7_9LAMI